MSQFQSKVILLRKKPLRLILKVKNRKNKILFFNLWFVLFCEITDK